MTITHAQLVARGARWLFNTKLNPIVVTELTSGIETPDILGWHGGLSTEIEVKVSFSDFLADQKKSSRRDPTRGIAMRRYYLVPEELVVRIDGRQPQGWGILYLAKNGRSIRVHKESDQFEVDRREDIFIFQSIVRRLAGMNAKLQGVQVRCYVDNSWMERERLVREYERTGVPVDEDEIAKKLEPRASLLVAPE